MPSTVAIAVWAFVLPAGVIAARRPTTRGSSFGPFLRTLGGSQSKAPGDISVVDLGADPSGTSDSSNAFQQAVDMAAAMPSMPTVHLEGGLFMLNSTVMIRPSSSPCSDQTFPSICQGYMRIAGGRVFAASTFSGASLFAVSGAASVAFEFMEVDCRRRAGGLLFDNTLQCTVNNLYIHHFSTYGIRGSKGHELWVSNSWLGEHEWGEPGYNDRSRLTGTAIDLSMPDAAVLDSVIKCSRTGIVSQYSSSSNLVQGNHIYTTCSQDSTGTNVSAGIVIATSSEQWGGARILDNYLDDSTLSFENPRTAVVRGNMFYGSADLVLNVTVPGHQITSAFGKQNQFNYNTKIQPKVQLLISEKGSLSTTCPLSSSAVSENSFTTGIQWTTVSRVTGNCTECTDLQLQLESSWFPEALPWQSFSLTAQPVSHSHMVSPVVVTSTNAASSSLEVGLGDGSAFSGLVWLTADQSC
eukprot:gene12565-351_t